MEQEPNLPQLETEVLDDAHFAEELRRAEKVDAAVERAQAALTPEELAEYGLDRLRCLYEERSPQEPCWGEIRSYSELRSISSLGTPARVVTCCGHAHVPAYGRYYREGEREQNARRGGTLRLSLPASESLSLGLELEELWDGGTDREYQLSKSPETVPVLCELGIPGRVTRVCAGKDSLGKCTTS